jgi:hypothetical protein
MDIGAPSREEARNVIQDADPYAERIKILSEGPMYLEE